MEHDLQTGPISQCGTVAGNQSQVITDDFVESLTEIATFFMPQNIAVNPVEQADEYRKAIPLKSNVLLAEICSQQILQCDSRLSVRLSGWILEGFAQPREFTYLLFHNLPSAKIFPGRDNFQTFGLSEFLRLEYPEISLELTESLFDLHFVDYSSGSESPSVLNGGGCLLLDK